MRLNRFRLAIEGCLRAPRKAHDRNSCRIDTRMPGEQFKSVIRIDNHRKSPKESLILARPRNAPSRKAIQGEGRDELAYSDGGPGCFTLSTPPDHGGAEPRANVHFLHEEDGVLRNNRWFAFFNTSQKFAVAQGRRRHRIEFQPYRLCECWSENDAINTNHPMITFQKPGVRIIMFICLPSFTCGHPHCLRP